MNLEQELASLRWGDRTTFKINAPGGVSEGTSVQGQLVNAHWRWPIVWQLAIVLNPNLNADETHTFIVEVDVTFGSGQGQITMPLTYTFVASAPGVYAPQVDFRVLPAKDIQIVAGLSGSPNSAAAENFDVGVFVAPITESMAQVALAHANPGVSMPRQGGWMGPGFNPEELRYR